MADHLGQAPNMVARYTWCFKPSCLSDVLIALGELRTLQYASFEKVCGK